MNLERGKNEVAAPKRQVMSKVKCKKCRHVMLMTTAERTGGLCMACLLREQNQGRVDTAYSDNAAFGAALTSLLGS